MPEPRDGATRRNDLEQRLTNDKDLWVASASPQGEPCLVPLSFLWDGAQLYLATITSNPTASNIEATGRAQVVVGHPRDVGLMEMTGGRLPREEAKQLCQASYAKKCGWDPLETKSYEFYALTPRRVECWREQNEHPDRLMMEDGRWLVGAMES
jgi:Pyridoxamine 5'-phosphate oxidase